MWVCFSILCQIRRAKNASSQFLNIFQWAEDETINNAEWQKFLEEIDIYELLELIYKNTRVVIQSQITSQEIVAKKILLEFQALKSQPTLKLIKFDSLKLRILIDLNKHPEK